MSTSPRPAVTPQAVVGVSICLMGIALTLDNLGLYELRSFIELWPLVPVSIGVLTLMYGEGKQDWIKGTLWLAFGIFFIFRHPLMHDVWPLVLVALGVYLVWRSRSNAAAARHWREAHATHGPHGSPGSYDMPGSAGFPGSPESYESTSATTSATATSASTAASPAGSAPASATASPSYGTATGAPPPSFQPPPIPETHRAGTAPGPPPWAKKSWHRGGSWTSKAWCPTEWRTSPPPPPAGAAHLGPDATQFGVGGHSAGQTGQRRFQRPSLFALMSGVRRQVTGGFAGAEATAIMGGVELDLRYAAMEGDQVTIDTFALWGGIEIWVPSHWEIVSQGLPLMGSFEDKTHVTVHGQQPRLIIRGVAIMGGVEIKN